MKVQVVLDAIFAIKYRVAKSVEFGTNKLVICGVVSFKKHKSDLSPLTYFNRKYY
jgi:flavin reductase (DIM6/NTAB) family NADH-FMN oxidoreductase RutF